MLLQENTNSRTFRFYWTAIFHCGDYKARKVGVKCVLAKGYQFDIWSYDFMFYVWILELLQQCGILLFSFFNI
jgi:hypothetical protein